MKDKPVHQSTIENPYVINEFGYVSQESAGFYEKFMNKYCNVEPEGYYLVPPSNTEMKVFNGKNKIPKTKHRGHKRRRVKSKETISDDDDEDLSKKINNSIDNDTYKVVLCSDSGETPKVPRIKILLPVRRPQHEDNTQDISDKLENSNNPKIELGKVDSDTSCKGNASKVEFANQPKRQYVPPPLSFEELLKLAEKKQHEPVRIKDSEFDFKRPMTRKEKALYLEKVERLKLRKEKLKKEKSVNDPAHEWPSYLFLYSRTIIVYFKT